MFQAQDSEKEGMTELVAPNGLLLGYIFKDSIDQLLWHLNNGKIEWPPIEYPYDGNEKVAKHIITKGHEQEQSGTID